VGGKEGGGGGGKATAHEALPSSILYEQKNRLGECSDSCAKGKKREGRISRGKEANLLHGQRKPWSHSLSIRGGRGREIKGFKGGKEIEPPLKKKGEKDALPVFCRRGRHSARGSVPFCEGEKDTTENRVHGERGLLVKGGGDHRSGRGGKRSFCNLAGKGKKEKRAWELRAEKCGHHVVKEGRGELGLKGEGGEKTTVVFLRGFLLERKRGTRLWRLGRGEKEKGRRRLRGPRGIDIRRKRKCPALPVL